MNERISGFRIEKNNFYSRIVEVIIKDEIIKKLIFLLINSI